MAALFCCSRYSGPASRAGIRRLIIRRMNNSPCNLRATRSKIVQRGGRKPTGNRQGEGEGEGGGTKAIISCPVTLRRYVKKLTASRDPPPAPFLSFFPINARRRGARRVKARNVRPAAREKERIGEGESGKQNTCHLGDRLTDGAKLRVVECICAG